MIRRASLLAAAIAAMLFSARAGAGQTVAVRSGEHDGFTRLVLYIPEGAEWTTQETETGYVVALDDRVEGFDLSDAFRRIPRDRIVGIEPGDAPGTLDIAIACDCHLETLLHRPGMLVIDIVDGPHPAATIAAEDGPRSLPGAPPVTLAEIRPDEARVQPILPLFVAPPPASVLPLPDSTFPAPTPQSAAIAESERAILESFARAASQGVFDFTTGIVPGAGLMPITDPMDGAALAAGADAPDRPGVILRTGIDRGTEVGEPGETLPTCTGLDVLDSVNWVDARDFTAQIGDARIALTTETGRIEPEAVLTLAQRYVAFGFGAEAAQVLALAPRDAPELASGIETLSVLAQIVDGATAPNTALAQAMHCGPEAAFWATLARGTLEGTDDAHRDNTIVGFRDLPPSLRGHLGLRLASLFSAVGEALIAEQIIAGARHEVTGDGFVADVAQAEVAGVAGGPEAEISQLDEIARRNSRTDPETLLRLLELSNEAGVPSDPAVLELARSFRFEARGSGTEGALAAAEVRARILGGDYRAALDMIDETASALGDDREVALLAEVQAAAAQLAEDGAFLDIALQTPAGFLPSTVQNDIAARLIDLGFPDLAQSFLAGPATQEAMRERRYLRAAAAAALGDVTATDLALEGMTDTRAQGLRATARATAGDFTGAYEARDRIPGAADPLAGSSPTVGLRETPQVTDTLAWRAGDWSELETSDDVLLSTASRAVLSPPAQPGEDTPLADRYRLIGQAEETRALTEALLERFTVDPPGEG